MIVTAKNRDMLGKHAIVIGGSVCGLLSARVLSEYFERVTIVDRDTLSETADPRKGVPQGHHVHVIFGGGVNVIKGLYPGFFEELVEAGSTVCDFARDLCWYHAGVWKARPSLDLTSYWQSRPFLEGHVRRRTRQDTAVEFLEEHVVTGLLSNSDRTRVTGIEVSPKGKRGDARRLDADLVVDASGRASQTPKWLEAMGYAKPKETRVEVNIGYASRIYEPTEDASRDWKIMALYGTPPKCTRTGYIFPIEGGRWLASQVGFLTDYPPEDDETYLDFSKGMELPDFYDALKMAKPVSSVASFRFPANRWRRYDHLARFPQGLIPIGDAICTFNPVYGQGMSTAALEVAELHRQLERCRPQQAVSADFAKTFFQQSAKIIGIPWLLATQSDYLYPQTRGDKPLQTDTLNWYLLRMLQLCSGNERVLKTFYEVMHFLKKPAALFHPLIALPVLGRAIGLKASYRPSKVRPTISSSR